MPREKPPQAPGDATLDRLLAMSADPPAPAANADAATRARYAFDVALRHALGDPAMSPAAPVHAAPPPAANGAPAAHREGC